MEYCSRCPNILGVAIAGPSAKGLDKPGGKPASAAVVAAPIRKLWEAQDSVENPKRWSRWRKMEVTVSLVRNCPVEKK